MTIALRKSTKSYQATMYRSSLLCASPFLLGFPSFSTYICVRRRALRIGKCPRFNLGKTQQDLTTHFIRLEISSRRTNRGYDFCFDSTRRKHRSPSETPIKSDTPFSFCPLSFFVVLISYFGTIAHPNPPLLRLVQSSL